MDWNPWKSSKFGWKIVLRWKMSQSQRIHWGKFCEKETPRIMKDSTTLTCLAENICFEKVVQLMRMDKRCSIIVVDIDTDHRYIIFKVKFTRCVRWERFPLKPFGIDDLCSKQRAYAPVPRQWLLSWKCMENALKRKTECLLNILIDEKCVSHTQRAIMCFSRKKHTHGVSRCCVIWIKYVYSRRKGHFNCGRKKIIFCSLLHFSDIAVVLFT